MRLLLATIAAGLGGALLMAPSADPPAPPVAATPAPAPAPATELEEQDRGVSLVSPRGRIGQALLLHEGRRMPLPGIRAGRVVVGNRVRRVKPGLAVDHDAGIAYVAAADAERLVVVDLREPSVERHRLRPPPGAQRIPKGALEHRRHLAWLGRGRLALAGSSDLARGGIVPHGLRLIDARTRRQTMLAPRQQELETGGGRLVAWDYPQGGIAVFGEDGRRRHRLMRGVQVYSVDILPGDRARVLAFHRGGRPGKRFLVGLRTGRVVHRPRARRAERGVAASSSPAAEPVLGIAYRRSPRGRLALRDPLTLKPVGPSATVQGWLWGRDRSPDGRHVALGISSRGRIQILATDPVRHVRTIRTGRREAIRELRWASAGRLVAIAGFERPEVLVVDAAAGRVLSRAPLGGRDLAAAAVDGGLVALVAPHEGVGDARLMVLRADAPPRAIALPGVRAGLHAARRHVSPDDPPDLLPGLAVDGGAAYVAPPGPATIVRADLESGAVTTHALSAATAKGGAQRIRRLARVAPGRLLLGGVDLPSQGRPAEVPLRIVDTGDWSSLRLPGASGFGEPAAGGVLVPRWERGGSVTLYDARGRRGARFRVRFGISRVVVAGGYAYVANAARRGWQHRTHVLDLATGQVVRTLRFTSLPVLVP